MQRPAPLRKSCHKQNFCAILVALGALTVLYFSYDPKPAGANPGESIANLGALEASLNANADIEASSGEGAAIQEGELRGRMAVLMQVLLLEKGLEWIKNNPAYTATFYKKERIGANLTDDQFISLKLRNEPFSVYMKWIKGNDEGQEILYVDGENNNEMLVKVGGVGGRMLPALKLDPHGSMAMSKARYPVTKLGFKQMLEEILQFRRTDLANMSGVKCRMLEDQQIDGRECYCFIVEYGSPERSEIFRKSVIYLDEENGMPVCVKNFGWLTGEQQQLDPKEADKESLLEFYSFSDVSFENKLASADFSRENENYHFKR